MKSGFQQKLQNDAIQNNFLGTKYTPNRILHFFCFYYFSGKVECKLFEFELLYFFESRFFIGRGGRRELVN